MFASKTIVLLLALAGATLADHPFVVTNNCNQVIWPGVFADPNPNNNYLPANGGFRLNPGDSKSFNVPQSWTAGRIWGRTGCDANGQNCETGDCGALECRQRTALTAVTLAEFGLNAWSGLDFWDISQVDGNNLPMSITPIAGSVPPDDASKCRKITCRFDFNACPDSFRQYGRNGMVACKSACTATRDDQYCCPEPKYNRNTCPQPSDYSRIFKNQCPDAYSYAYDDDTSTFVCRSGSSPSGYQVTFCP